MSKVQPTPQRFRETSEEALFFEEIKKRVNISEVTDLASSPISVTSPNATDLATVITLANELKADVNNLVTALNFGSARINELFAAMKAAGLMDS